MFTSTPRADTRSAYAPVSCLLSGLRADIAPLLASAGHGTRIHVLRWHTERSKNTAGRILAVFRQCAHWIAAKVIRIIPVLFCPIETHSEEEGVQKSVWPSCYESDRVGGWSGSNGNDAQWVLLGMSLGQIWKRWTAVMMSGCICERRKIFSVD